MDLTTRDMLVSDLAVYEGRFLDAVRSALSIKLVGLDEHVSSYFHPLYNAFSFTRVPATQSSTTNASQTPPTSQVPRCRYHTHTITRNGKEEKTVGRPVETCPTCGDRKVCGAMVGHVCLNCEPQYKKQCSMCRRSMYECTC